MDLTDVQSRAIRIVDQGLTVLEKNWGRGTKPEVVYSMAAVLRDLLIHGSFPRAWGLVWEPGSRSKITVVAPDLRALVPEGRDDAVVFAQTAGFAVPGMHLWMPVGLSDTMPLHPSQIRSKGDSPQESAVNENANEERRRIVGDKISLKLEGAIMSGLIDQESVPLAPASCYRRYTLQQFLASPCLIHHGKLFTRKTLVASFANNLGAAHIDWHGTSSEYNMLTNNEWLEITGRSPSLYEVLSIGQILSRSMSAKLFHDRVVELGLGPLR